MASANEFGSFYRFQIQDFQILIFKTRPSWISYYSMLILMIYVVEAIIRKKFDKLTIR